ncbi:hypothetical protein BOTBODRAFT_56444 [Botryobasidium botryosum FD-172 SS1]|uniref:Uncharacterized protein n=1 Tax=Botryobasidium botryosum (strain FD-172 SS1) TaxID=930990 RepID=A0A067MDZ2_BOTB1|nr:hypothetical protein BOTBODRAFT_56444 [Botryobasidium botryosum FD-172 SS1]
MARTKMIVRKSVAPKPRGKVLRILGIGKRDEKVAATRSACPYGCKAWFVSATAMERHKSVCPFSP